jgi:membrane protease YdiL (CAAX protease family)
VGDTIHHRALCVSRKDDAMQMTDGTLKAKALAVMGIGLFLGLAAMPLGHWAFPSDELWARLGREGIWWLIGLLVVLWVLLVERRPLRSIGLRAPTVGTGLWGVGAAVLMMATVMLSYAMIFPALHLTINKTAVAEITHVPLWMQTATMVRAGVVEEIVFRGYAIERLQFLTGSKWIAGALSTAAFIAVHIGSWGYPQLIVVSFGALILTALYLLRRDLASNMFAHFLTDFVAFMLARLQGG